MSHKIRIFENFWWNISWFEDKKRQKPKILRCKELRINDDHFDIQNVLGPFDVVKFFRHYIEHPVLSTFKVNYRGLYAVRYLCAEVTGVGFGTGLAVHFDY